jgi:hypothetical protein
VNDLDVRSRRIRRVNAPSIAQAQVAAVWDDSARRSGVWSTRAAVSSVSLAMTIGSSCPKAAEEIVTSAAITI